MTILPDQAKRPVFAPHRPIDSSHRAARTGLLRGALIVSTLALCVGAAALGMVPPSSSVIEPPEQTLRQDVVAVPPAQTLTEDDPAPASQPFIAETRVRPGDTLATILNRLDLRDPSLLAFLTRDVKARSAYKLIPGRIVQAATSQEGDLQWMRYVHTPGGEGLGRGVARILEIRPNAIGGYMASEIEQSTDSIVQVAVGTISRSLFAATDQAGIPDAVTSQMAEILSSKIDFLRDLRRGDQFRVVYEMRSHEGRIVGAGRVLALEFTNRGKKYDAVWYSADGISGGYYSLEGESLQGAFLQSALKFSRVSSTFGMRKSPMHGEWEGHAGIDYAAPTGTPIHATADGVVEVAGWKSGYGNTVIIKHRGKISTLYGHQSRLAEGITAGTRVTQGQLIGYVGSTGWSTGAHLHYEFRINDKPVDPLSVAMPESQPIEPAMRDAFALATSAYRQQLQVLASFQDNVPDVSNVASR